jgi:hypothetical protein
MDAPCTELPRVELISTAKSGAFRPLGCDAAELPKGRLFKACAIGGIETTLGERCDLDRQ